MPRRLKEETRAIARRLRHDMTNAEVLMWKTLRNREMLGAKFRRQVPIGPYFADFACLAAKLIVELDGRPHESEEKRIGDASRDAWLREQGWCVLRFHNDLILGGSEVVAEEIAKALRQR